MNKTKSALMAVAASAILLSAGTAMAGYGSAGCGLGAVLLGDKAGFMQVFAATTNASFYSQTFGITSGTSECGAGPAKVGKVEHYLETNRAAFAKDAARGSGDTLVGLSKVAGCANPALVGKAMQKNYSEIFPNVGVTDAEVAKHVISTLKANPALACGDLG